MTAETIPQFEVPGNPYHPNWQSLSLVHRADYLRCYLMHHYGGGYVDLKRLTADWSSVFDRFDEEPNLWAIGYPEVSSTAVAEVGGLLGLVLRRNYRKLIGNGAFIFRPHTPLTAEWLAEVERRIDLHSKELRLSPGNERGNNSGYPVRWTEILGEVLAPLVLKYNEHIESTKTIRPDFKRYL
ncbi:hypothetical protein [Neomicrococcus lactis]|uniref:hypothetical protein n=1 Tax=Neomicrococcus lactis TaxID=732241 RepID=UPI002301D753|nr:hypothetical protein [Neomicrococcus lactis]